MTSIIFGTILFGLFQSQPPTVTISDPTIECFVNSTDISHKDCYYKEIIGENTEKVICMNKDSCRLVRFSITPGQSFQFEAGPFSFSGGDLLVPGNVESVKCEGINACIWTNWILVGNIDNGFSIECKGVESCANGFRILTYPKSIECIGMYGCIGLNLDIILMPEKDEFKVKCYDMDSCYFQKWKYKIPHDYRLICKLGADDTQSCNGIFVNATDPKVTLDCIAECEPGACGSIIGCTIIESFKVNNNKNKLSTTATTIIIIIFSTISILLAIVLMIFCIYKNKKYKTQVTFEKHNENDNIANVEVEAVEQITGSNL